MVNLFSTMYRRLWFFSSMNFIFKIKRETRNKKAQEKLIQICIQDEKINQGQRGEEEVGWGKQDKTKRSHKRSSKDRRGIKQDLTRAFKQDQTRSNEVR